jgi:hypothetical protein
VAGEKDPWKQVRDGFDKWIKISCYIACLYWLVGMLPYLPRELADKIVALLLSKIGL